MNKQASSVAVRTLIMAAVLVVGLVAAMAAKGLIAASHLAS